MKVHPAGLSIDFAKRAVLFLPLKQTGLLLNLNISLKIRAEQETAVIFPVSSHKETIYMQSD